MIINMKAKVALTSIALLLAGCARSELEFKKEPLTGEEYCVVKSKLLAVKSSELADFSLKYAKGNAGEKAPIKANLFITQSGREYHINPHETLKLYIDGVPHALTIHSSFQDPREVPEHYSVFVPTRAITLGSIKEVTVRWISFFLPQDYLTKMVNAKRVVFEISSDTHNPTDSTRYPIILEITPENISLIQEFKNKCVNNLHQSGLDK